VVQHMKKFQSELDQEFNKRLAKANADSGTFRMMVKDYSLFLKLDAFERNEYQFYYERAYCSGKKNLEEMGISLNESPYLAYGISVPNIYILENINNKLKPPKLNFVSSYAISNSLGATCKVDTIFRVENEAHAIISYTQNIRVVYKLLKCSAETDFVKKQQVKLYGFKQKEEYIFDNTNNKWVFREVR
jgi:hypothetical protein